MKLFIFLQYVLILSILVTAMFEARRIRNPGLKKKDRCEKIFCPEGRKCKDNYVKVECLLIAGKLCSYDHDCYSNDCSIPFISISGNRVCRRSSIFSSE